MLLERKEEFNFKNTCTLAVHLHVQNSPAIIECTNAAVSKVENGFIEFKVIYKNEEGDSQTAYLGYSSKDVRNYVIYHGQEKDN